MIYLDFETYSPVDIAAGSVKYMRHPDADIVCMGYKIDDGPVGMWTPGQDLPEEFHDNKSVFVAHNALFDYLVWDIIGKKYEFPTAPLARWRDSQALVNRYTLPGALAKAGDILGVEVQKSRTGKALIKKISCPMKDGRRPKPGVDFTMDEATAYLDYCRQDVESMYQLIKALPADELAKDEQQYWLLTQRMNLAGLPVDIRTVEKIFGYIDGYVEELTKRVPEITGNTADRVTQIAKIRNWMLKRGIQTSDLRAGTVDTLLAGELPDDVREILILRQMMGRSSTAKYKKIMEMEIDGRVYNNLQYYGTSTGRWAGRGFQLQNLPRASVPDPDVFIDKFNNFKFVDDPVNVAKALIRPMICAPKGKMLIVSDYSSIENRLLAWVAGDEEALELFRSGGDQYVDMACFMYKKKAEDITKTERQIGKIIILGCLAEDTIVFTDKGLKPLKNLEMDDLLWDGKKWVKHGGLLHKGIKPCVSWAGVNLTPDHEVFITSEKEEIWRHLGNSLSVKKAICLAFGMFLDSSQGQSLLRAMPLTKSFAPSVKQPTSGMLEIWKAVHQLNAAIAADSENINSIWTHIQKLQGLTKKQSIDSLIDGMPLNLDAITQRTPPINGMGPEELKWLKIGKPALELFLSMLKLSQDTTTPNWSSIAPTITGGTSQEISALLPIESRYTTLDVLNAGDLNRFQILTANGPIIVSNCGYGMGAKRFMETALDWGVTLSQSEALVAVNAYRERYHLVKKLWYRLKDHCVAAIQNPGQVYTYNACAFKVVKDRTGGRWLTLKLPSGRLLFYKDPYLEEDDYGTVPGHYGINPYSKKWSRLKLIPGRITENVIQALARDIMAYGLQQIDINIPEVTLLGTNHDEAIGEIAETDLHEDTMNNFNYYMCFKPDWAEGLPLEADGYIAKRYKKG